MCHQNKNFKIWAEKGITLLEHCFDGDVLMSFEQLKNKYNLSNKEFFSYLQLRDFLRVKAKTFPKLPDLTFVEQLCYSDKPLYKTISRIYEALISNQPLDDPDKSRKRWEQDLGGKNRCRPVGSIM